MQQPTNWVEKRQSLRSGAEKMLTAFSPDIGAASTWEVLFHELMVHKVELEMQIEELRDANVRIQEKGEDYKYRHEQAPVACISIDTKGLIIDINRNGAQLLGLEAAQLLKRPLAKYMAATGASDRWHLLLQELLWQTEPQDRRFVLEMQPAQGKPFKAYFCSRVQRTPGQAAVLNLVVSDVDSLKQAEAEAEALAHHP
jgi:PAS domain S-box-containing protein